MNLGKYIMRTLFLLLLLALPAAAQNININNVIHSQGSSTNVFVLGQTNGAAGPTRLIPMWSTIAASGIATLSSGTATVSTAAANTAYPIILTYYSLDGTGANIRYGTVLNGVAFTITSSNGADNNKVAWAILRP